MSGDNPRVEPLPFGPLKISAVVFKEGEFWIGQCLEQDITCQAKTPGELHKELMKSIIASVVLSLELGKKPLEGISPAPKKFWEMFEKSHMKIEAVCAHIPMVTPTAIPEIIPFMKLGELDCGSVHACAA